MPKPDVSEERKAQIIDASIDVFGKRGFEKARMDDIAKKANLAKGTLYLYFKNKDEIVKHAIASMIEGELSQIKDLHSADLSAKDRLQSAIEMVVMDFKKFEKFLPFFFEIYAHALRSKSIRNFLGVYLDAYLDALIPIIEQGIERGEFRDVEPENAAISIGAMIEGTLLLMIYDPTRINLDEHIRFGVDIILNGLLI